MTFWPTSKKNETKQNNIPHYNCIVTVEREREGKRGVSQSEIPTKRSLLCFSAFQFPCVVCIAKNENHHSYS